VASPRRRRCTSARTCGAPSVAVRSRTSCARIGQRRARACARVAGLLACAQQGNAGRLDGGSHRCRHRARDPAPSRLAGPLARRAARAVLRGLRRTGAPRASHSTETPDHGRYASAFARRPASFRRSSASHARRTRTGRRHRRSQSAVPMPNPCRQHFALGVRISWGSKWLWIRRLPGVHFAPPSERADVCFRG